MLKETVNVTNFEDCRWSLLICLGFLLIAVGLSKLQLVGAKTSGSASMSTKTWLELELRWEEEGQFGQGIYSNRDKSALVQTIMVKGAASREKNLVEPHLAVFTFRAIDINRVDFNTLRVIKGVGPKMALAIVTYRQNHGPFHRIEDLLEIKGVGPAKFKLLSRSLKVTAADNKPDS